MDGSRFDALSRMLSADRSRRATWRLLTGLLIGSAASDSLVTPVAAKKKCPACKKRKKGKCKKNLPDGTACPGGACEGGKCLAFPPCPDGRPVCENGACCSPDKTCFENGPGLFVCSCGPTTAGCDNFFCIEDDGCPGVVNPEACTCDGACEDGRGLCDDECCPPTQVCQRGVCGCPAGTVECQPAFCASANCPDGKPRNATTCVCEV